MVQNYGLGRGLASLIPKKNNAANPSSQQAYEAKPEEGEISIPQRRSGIMEVEVEKIIPNPYQPRLKFDEEKLHELSESILSHGIIQPLVVSRNGDAFELIAGERRLQAAKQAGLKKVPVILRDAKEKEKLELALTENVQRHDLDPIEEARAYKRLMEEFQIGQEEVALKVSKSRSAIANKLRLLNLPVEIQRALSEGKISEGHAKAILAIDNPEKQRALFELILKNGLTVRQVEEKTKEVSVRAHKRKVNVDPRIKEIEDKIGGALGTKVKVTQSGEGGKIIVEYYSEEELQGILNRLL